MHSLQTALTNPNVSTVDHSEAVSMIGVEIRVFLCQKGERCFFQNRKYLSKISILLYHFVLIVKIFSMTYCKPVVCQFVEELTFKYFNFSNKIMP